MKTNNPIAKLTAGIAIVALFTITLTNCGNKQAKESENFNEVTKEEAYKDVTSYPIPTAFEVVQLINKAGASYIISICNPVDNVNKYITENEKAINLGVYGADLAYSTTYQMKQETMNYLKVSKQLIDELNINTGFNRELAEKVEQNIDNKDTLIQIISNSYYDTYRSLIENDKEVLSLLVISGSWIEGTYLTSELAFTSRDNTALLSILAGQKAPLNKLIELLEARKDMEEIAKLIEKFAPITTLYQSVTTDTLTPEQFETLYKEIAQLRNSVI